MIRCLRLALVALLALAAPSAFAQTVVDGSEFVAVRGWNGTSVFNVGDAANTALRVNVVAGGGAGGTSSTFGAAFPATGTAAGFSDGTNMQAARVVDLDTGAGTQYGLINNLVRRASGGSVELIGSSTSANSLPVVIASDQAAVTTQPANIASANNDGAAVSIPTSNTVALASFSTRKFAAVCSLPTNTDTVFLKFGATATNADFPLTPGMCWNALPGTVYSGVISAIANSGTQSLAVTEW